VRTATTGVSRMGGWNKKSVMSPKLLVVDRNKQAGASPLRSGHTSHITTIPLLYHQYHYYTTNITSISFHYHSTVLLCWAPLVHAADRCERTACDCSAIARWRPHYLFS
jgi:hypothetical protein